MSGFVMALHLPSPSPPDLISHLSLSEFQGGGGPATGKVAELIARDFGSFDAFKVRDARIPEPSSVVVVEQDGPTMG